MELDEFIAETIYGIQNGVTKAISKTRDISGAINPVWGTNNDISERHIQEVKFDIAITVEEKASATGGAGIKVLGLGASGELDSESTNIHASRIQFTIPIIPAVQNVTDA